MEEEESTFGPPSGPAANSGRPAVCAKSMFWFWGKFFNREIHEIRGRKNRRENRQDEQDEQVNGEAGAAPMDGLMADRVHCF